MQEFDLLRAGLSVLPAQLALWRRLNAAFDVVATENQLAGQDGAPRVPQSDFQLWAFASGEVLPQARCHEATALHFRHNAVMADVRMAYARKHRFGTHQTSAINPEDRQHLYRSGVAGWWFSGRPRVVLRTMERRLIALRLGFIRSLRNLSSMASFVTDRLGAICVRGLIGAALINKVKQDLGRYTATLEIGNAEDVDDGLGASFSLEHCDNPAKAFADAGLATGIGSAVWVDFLVRQDASDKALSRAVATLQSLLQEMVGGELGQMGSFHGLKVFRWQHEADKCVVARVALQFKPDTSVDLALRQLNVGLKFSDALPELSASLHLSHPLTEMLESERFAVGDVCVAASGAALVARQVVAAVAAELLYLAEDEAGASRVEQAERRAAHAAALERTAAAVPAEPSLTGTLTGTLTGLAAEKRVDTDASIGLRSFKARLLRRSAWALASFVHATKACAIEQRFASLEECFFGGEWVAALLPLWCTRRMVQTPGALATLWKETSGWLSAQLDVHWRRVVNQEKSAAAWAEQARVLKDEKLRNLSEKERARLAFMADKAALAAKLGAMGLGGEVEVEAPVSDVEADRQRKSAQVKSERAVLETYEACWRALYAVHGLTVQTGTHKFSLALQGLDVLEVLPEPPPTPKCLAPRPVK
jgi:hypothetical protein